MKKFPLAFCRLPSLISSLAAIHTTAHATTLVDLNATTLPLGPVNAWPNSGTVGGTFAATGTPQVVSVGGYRAVNLAGGAQYFTGPAAPAAISGENKPVTVEVWTYNRNIPGEETLLAWGRRGGPDATNASYNYGTDRRWGAVGHWGGQDIGWIDQDATDGAPAANAWHYLTWTYDGTTERLYADGVAMHFEDKSLNVWAVDNTPGALPLPFRLGAQNNADGTVAQFNDGINILRVRVQDTVMTPEQITAKYNSEKAALDVTRGASVTAFTSNRISFQPGEAVTLSYTLDRATSASIDNGVGALSPLTSGTVVVRPVGLTTYTLAVSNANGTESASITVAPVATLVSLDGTTLPMGPLSAWPNTGTAGGTFTASGTPRVVTVGGYRAVNLADGSQFFTGPAAPASITGVNKPVTVEVWAYNPTIPGEETLVAWGRRGGPDATNASYNYGIDRRWGAVGHWGGQDIGWIDQDATDGAPEADAWHYLTWTYDGTTERLYADGVPMHFEDKSLNIWGVDTTGAPLPFRLGAQNNGDGTVAQFNDGINILRVRIQNAVLTPEQIASRYTTEKSALDATKVPSITTFTANAIQFQPGDAITLTYALTGAASASIDNGVGALSPLTGGTRVIHPTVKTTYTLTATNANGPATASITVQPFSTLVNLDATTLPLGAVTAWPNTGTVGGTFTASGTPQVVNVGGYRAVNLAGGAQYFTGPAAPDLITGINKPVTVEVWTYNPNIPGEETLLAWGRRGGGDGTNVSYNYGTNRDYGAVGHWGGPDMGWLDQDGATDAVPVARAWHYLAWTYDGTTERLYSDGVPRQSEDKSLNIFGSDNAGRALPFRVGAQNNANGTVAQFNDGINILRVRIQDSVMTPEQIAAKYTSEKAALDQTKAASVTTFTANQVSFQLGEAVTFSYTLANATSASIDNGVGALSPLTSGTVVVRPVGQTTYILTVSNANGAETASITLSPVATLVNLDATTLPLGPLTAWPNTGTVGGTFSASGTPQVVTTGGYRTVNLADGSQFFTGPAAPVSITGINKPVTVEVWAYNPTIPGEETLVAWGRRGGPDATNASYNYGTDRRWGAVGHWGGPDIGWTDQDLTDGAPEAEAWHYLTWTYDGTTERLYADGVAMHFEDKSLNIWGVDNTATARPLPFRLGAQNNADGTVAQFNDGINILRVRIQNAVMTPAQVASRYTSEKAALDAANTPSTTFRITDAVATFTGGIPTSMALTWPSTPGRTYKVEQSADLRSWVVARNAAGTDLIIPAASNSTTASAVLSAGPRSFLRVKDITP